jgi:hypothetical protein
MHCLPFFSRPFTPNCKIPHLKFWVSGFPYVRCRESPVLTDSRSPNMPMHYPLALALPWLCFGSCDPVLCDRSPIPCRDSGFRDFRCHEPLSSQTPDSRFSDELRLYGLAPTGYTLVYMTCLRDRGFVSLYQDSRFRRL